MKDCREFIVKGKEIGHSGTAKIGRYATLKQAMRAGRAWLSDSFMARECIIVGEDEAGYASRVARATEWSGWILY